MKRRIEFGYEGEVEDQTPTDDYDPAGCWADIVDGAFVICSPDRYPVCRDEAAWERFKAAELEYGLAKRALFEACSIEPWDAEELARAETCARRHEAEMSEWRADRIAENRYGPCEECGSWGHGPRHEVGDG